MYMKCKKIAGNKYANVTEFQLHYILYAIYMLRGFLLLLGQSDTIPFNKKCLTLPSSILVRLHGSAQYFTLGS